MELKPCPFCGSTKIVREYGPMDRSLSMSCDDCWAQGPYTETVEDAVNGWNKRLEKGRKTMSDGTINTDTVEAIMAEAKHRYEQHGDGREDSMEWFVLTAAYQAGLDVAQGKKPFDK